MKQKYYCLGAALLLTAAAYLYVSQTLHSTTTWRDDKAVNGTLTGAKWIQRTIIVATNTSHSLHSQGGATPSTKQYFEVLDSTNMTFQDALKYRRGGQDNIIYLSSVDSAYVPMALNLYYTSFQKLGIENFLFACSDTLACEILRTHNIPCYDYLHDKDGSKPSAYGTAAFRRKTHMKSKIILDAMLLGIAVVIIDVDIVMFKDPIPYLDCADCDIQIQSDMSEGNSGFYLARPTKACISLHEKAWAIGNSPQGEKTSNQKALDRNMEKMSKAKTLKMKIISKDLFPPGAVYFESKKRMFYTDSPPKDEVIVHNNWIVSKEAKIYRFKELLLWDVDDNMYYSDPDRKYLAYDNTIITGDGKTIVSSETESLKSALAIGHLLQRTVILPAFTCVGCKYGACKVATKRCAFNTHYKIATFDAQFLGEYREHVFLQHRLVPVSVKNSVSQTYLIENSHIKDSFSDSSVKVLTPADKLHGATEEEIKTWFGDIKDSVLKFHSMYNAFKGFESDVYKDYKAKVSKSINTKTDYRQY